MLRAYTKLFRNSVNKATVFGLILLGTPAMAANLTAGLGYFDNQQYTQAFAEFKPLADQGDEVAQYYLSYLYLKGYGLPVNEKTGMDYLQKSVDQGFEKAQSLMAYFLSEGQHVKQDKEAAIKLYSEAAEKRDADALLNLGIIYMLGDTVDRDLEKALSYLNQININDKPVAGRYIGDIYQYSDDSIEREKSKRYYEAAAGKGDLVSYNTLARLAQAGKDGEKNIEQAISYYKYAASQGHTPSQYALGTLYANGGEGVQRNILTAYAWLSLAATEGLPVAIQAQRQLEESMTLSELDKARREIIEIQRNVMGKLEPPIKSIDIDPTIQGSAVQEKVVQSRPTGRRRPRGSRR